MDCGSVETLIDYVPHPGAEPMLVLPPHVDMRTEDAGPHVTPCAGSLTTEHEPPDAIVAPPPRPDRVASVTSLHGVNQGEPC
jgi:hypothetical protein